MATIRLNVNGEARALDLPPAMPLLWVLRDVLNLTGSHYGCGVGSCGACTVHVDGKAVQSCSTPVGTVEGRAVTTIEGLSADGSHPVQQAWVAMDAPQCGFCQAGQIMAAAALLTANPKPAPEEIDAGMSANVCRCGSYTRIRAAIQRAAGIGQLAEGGPA